MSLFGTRVNYFCSVKGNVMDIVLNAAKQFINDPTGDYKYLGELEHGKHFVSYMFSGNYMDGDIALCVGTKRILVIAGDKCRDADNYEIDKALEFEASQVEKE